jgi:phage FluMu protein Com
MGTIVFVTPLINNEMEKEKVFKTNKHRTLEYHFEYLSEPSLLNNVGRCPTCGKFVARGLLNYLRHATEKCPKQKLTTKYSTEEVDMFIEALKSSK